MSKLMLALVLCDINAHGLKAGVLLEAEPALIKALAAEGSVDPHREAVAHAKGNSAPVTRSSLELAAEATAARADALRVEIAKLEDLLGKAEDEATKGAISTQLVDMRAELAAVLAG